MSSKIPATRCSQRVRGSWPCLPSDEHEIDFLRTQDIVLYCSSADEATSARVALHSFVGTNLAAGAGRRRDATVGSSMPPSRHGVPRRRARECTSYACGFEQLLLMLLDDPARQRLQKQIRIHACSMPRWLLFVSGSWAGESTGSLLHAHVDGVPASAMCTDAVQRVALVH